MGATRNIRDARFIKDFDQRGREEISTRDLSANPRPFRSPMPRRGAPQHHRAQRRPSVTAAIPSYHRGQSQSGLAYVKASIHLRMFLPPLPPYKTKSPTKKRRGSPECCSSYTKSYSQYPPPLPPPVPQKKKKPWTNVSYAKSNGTGKTGSAGVDDSGRSLSSKAASSATTCTQHFDPNADTQCDALPDRSFTRDSVYPKGGATTCTISASENVVFGALVSKTNNENADVPSPSSHAPTPTLQCTRASPTAVVRTSGGVTNAAFTVASDTPAMLGGRNTVDSESTLLQIFAFVLFVFSLWALPLLALKKTRGGMRELRFARSWGRTSLPAQRVPRRRRPAFRTRRGYWAMALFLGGGGCPHLHPIFVGGSQLTDSQFKAASWGTFNNGVINIASE